ncbi:MAG: hypothetical protein HQM16_00950 [Deltaproteobacteria bacterium]|nr:hypothetical protein [Deltaproteobacteria bacterium]
MPVGTIPDRSRWHRTLNRLKANERSLTPEVQSTFSRVRKEMIAAGMPVEKDREQTTRSGWTRLLIGDHKKVVRTQDCTPLDEQTIPMLTERLLLNYKVPAKRHHTVPDLVLEELLRRHHFTPSPDIASALKTLMMEDPLRFASTLGVLYYLKVFEEAAQHMVPADAAITAPSTAQREMIDRLVDQGQTDGRVIPLIRLLIAKHAATFDLTHVAPLLAITEKFPVLQRSWKLLQARPELLCEAICRGHGDWGNVNISSQNLRSIIQAGGPVLKEWVTSHHLPQIINRKSWQLYASLVAILGKVPVSDFIYTNAHPGQPNDPSTTPAAICDVLLTTIQGQSVLNREALTGMTTMCVFDLMMRIYYPNKALAKQIREYLTRYRAGNLNLGQPLLNPENRDLSEFLFPLREAVFKHVEMRE